MEWIRYELERLKDEHLYRKRVDREGVIDFCSNDYLALRDHPEVVEESLKVLREWGLGSGASQLVSGYTKYHRRLEEELAEFKGTPRCVLFGSGYLANVGTIPVLAGEGDIILSDELNHASLIDGCRFSKARRFVFKHKDYDQLEEFLHKERRGFRRALILTDSVFSMEGDIADLRRLYLISQEYECMLYIDDAHGTGTMGDGRGALEHFNLKWRENVIIMGTLSKALGAYGAFVCGSEELAEFLVNRARSLIFTTSLPPSVCAGAMKSLEIVRREPELVSKLEDVRNKLVEILKELPYEVRHHPTPIVPLIVGDEGRSLELSEMLLKRGIFIQAIRYPTVPKGTARLRLTASLRHNSNDFQMLREALLSLTKV